MAQTLFMCFSPCVGVWRGGKAPSKAPSTAQNGNWKFSRPIFLYFHNDKKSYVKHVLDPLYVFFTICGCLEGEGLLNDAMTN